MYFSHLPYETLWQRGREAHAKPEINAIPFLFFSFFFLHLKLCDLLTLSSLSYSTCEIVTNPSCGKAHLRFAQDTCLS